MARERPRMSWSRSSTLFRKRIDRTSRQSWTTYARTLCSGFRTRGIRATSCFATTSARGAPLCRLRRIFQPHREARRKRGNPEGKRGNPHRPIRRNTMSRTVAERKTVGTARYSYRVGAAHLPRACAPWHTGKRNPWRRNAPTSAARRVRPPSCHSGGAPQNGNGGIKTEAPQGVSHGNTPQGAPCALG